MMKSLSKIIIVFMILGGGALVAHASDNLIVNPGFESYDSQTMIPLDWTLIDGRQPTVSTEHVDEGTASLYLHGGTAKRPENDPWGTPIVTGAPSPDYGTVAQVVDLSKIPGWETTNWLDINYRYFYNIKNAGNSLLHLEYLPASYDTVETMAADDPAWNSDDVVSTVKIGARATSEHYPWKNTGRWMNTPTVRWMRLVLNVNGAFKLNKNTITVDGKIFAAINKVILSVDANEFPLSPADPDNLLLNWDFEQFDPITAVPDHWNVLKGTVTAMDTERVRPVSGSRFIGHPGGALQTPPQETTYVTNTLVQQVDLSTIPQWTGSDYVKLSMSCLAMVDRNPTQNMAAVVEYLPKAYDDTEVAWDSEAWETEAITLIEHDFYPGFWKEYASPELPIRSVRWMRVRLVIESGYVPEVDPGDHRSGFFDRINFKAEAVTHESLVKNPGFETKNGTEALDWHSLDSQTAEIINDPARVYRGEGALGLNSDEDVLNSMVCQVIDLKDNISFWNGGVAKSDMVVMFPFIKYTVSAQVANLGGKKIYIGIEHLPESYNTTEDVPWNDPAWQKSDWVSDGSTFTNNGGDALASGDVICETDSGDWHAVTYTDWIPKARWVRLRIGFEADPDGSNDLVAIDDISFAASCELAGPYSGYGPRMGYAEDPNAPDQAVPGWIGPEGEGNCGGYTGQTKRNYVNPAFAGFADDFQNYIKSGQDIGMPGYEIQGVNITGSPFTDAGWQGMIVTTGDMDLAMLADYFGPSPSGNVRPGEITAVFNQAPITNGDGPDFACFENGFVLGWGSPEVWAELSHVEVSSNGVDFVKFPTHSLTPKWPGSYGTLVPQGLFGLVGKHVNAYGASYGTPFDLAWIADHELVLNGTVDLNDIRYVKLVDIPGGGPTDAKNGVVSMFKDAKGWPVFDAWVTWGTGGSDLDAVGVLNSSAADSDGDGIVDYWDNCPDTPNPRQFNTNSKQSEDDQAGDNYGNACDCDLNQDDVVDMADYVEFKKAWGGYASVRIQGDPGQQDTFKPSSSNWNSNADFNRDFKVNGADFQRLKQLWGKTAPFK
ncbi:MAG: hypothetical protein JEZ12_25700 [Desulfobacterium sp.]|nr:hypothetical protein [Desulfobacterium sp.]